MPTDKLTVHGWFRARISGSDISAGVWPVLRDAATLGLGTFLSQALLLLTTPIFLRHYHPADFGLYTLAYGLITLAATVGTWKVERFIIIAPARSAAIRLLTAMVWLGVLIALVVLCAAPVVAYIGRRLLVENSSGMAMMWLAPASIVFVVASSGMRFYTVRVGKFAVVSMAQISRTTVFVTGTVATGLVCSASDIYGALIMLGWQVAADACALFVQVRASPEIARLVVMRPRLRRCFREMATYRRTLGMLTLSELISALNQQVQIATVILTFGAAAGGWFSLARSLVFVPCSIISTAVNDVTNQRLSRYHAQGRAFSHIVGQATLWMAALGIVPFACLMILAPVVLPLLMGARWAGATASVMILVVASYFNFISAPGNTVTLIVQARRYILLWHGTRLTVVVLLSAAAGLGLISYPTWLVLLAASESLAYIVSGAAGSIFARSAETQNDRRI